MTKLLLPIVALALLMDGCASLQNIQQTLGTPEQVQADITILGALAKPHLSADVQGKIHLAAVQINSAANLDLTTLFALIPSTGSVNGDALVAAVKAYLTSFVQRWGSNNATTLSYAHAVGAGLLANFP